MTPDRWEEVKLLACGWLGHHRFPRPDTLEYPPMSDQRRTALIEAVNNALQALIDISKELERRYDSIETNVTSADFDYLLKCRMNQARALEDYLRVTEELFDYIRPKAKTARPN